VIALTFDTRAALAAREAAPLAPSHACLGCLARGARPAEQAEVSEPGDLCPDCAPRYADAGEHAVRCRCDECVWAGAVDRARPDADGGDL